MLVGKQSIQRGWWTNPFCYRLMCLKTFLDDKQSVHRGLTNKFILLPFDVSKNVGWQTVYSAESYKQVQLLSFDVFEKWLMANSLFSGVWWTKSMLLHFDVFEENLGWQTVYSAVSDVQSPFYYLLMWLKNSVGWQTVYSAGSDQQSPFCYLLTCLKKCWMTNSLFSAVW